MKEINEYINEGFVVEANGKLVAFFDHFNPETTWLIKGATPDQIKRIPDGYDVEEIPYTKNLINITHSDEWGYLHDTKCKTEAQFRSKVLKEIAKCLKGAEPEGVYIESDTLGFGNDFEDYDGKGTDYTKVTPEEAYSWFVAMYNDSYIDRDSASGRMIYDPENSKVVFGGGFDVICLTSEEFEQALKEWYEDE